MADPKGDAAFRHLEELVLTPEQRERHRERVQEWRKNMTPEQLERNRVACLLHKERAGVAADPELFAINQAGHRSRL
jgi:hypothetical protein